MLQKVLGFSDVNGRLLFMHLFSNLGMPQLTDIIYYYNNNNNNNNNNIFYHLSERTTYKTSFVSADVYYLLLVLAVHDAVANSTYSQVGRVLTHPKNTKLTYRTGFTGL